MISSVSLRRKDTERLRVCVACGRRCRCGRPVAARASRSHHTRPTMLPTPAKRHAVAAIDVAGDGGDGRARAWAAGAHGPRACESVTAPSANAGNRSRGGMRPHGGLGPVAQPVGTPARRSRRCAARCAQASPHDVSPGMGDADRADRACPCADIGALRPQGRARIRAVARRAEYTSNSSGEPRERAQSRARRAAGRMTVAASCAHGIGDAAALVERQDLDARLPRRRRRSANQELAAASVLERGSWPARSPRAPTVPAIALVEAARRDQCRPPGGARRRPGWLRRSVDTAVLRGIRGISIA